MPYCSACKGSGVMEVPHVPSLYGDYMDRNYYSSGMECGACGGSGYEKSNNQASIGGESRSASSCYEPNPGEFFHFSRDDAAGSSRLSSEIPLYLIPSIGKKVDPNVRIMDIVSRNITPSRKNNQGQTTGNSYEPDPGKYLQLDLGGDRSDDAKPHPRTAAPGGGSGTGGIRPFGPGVEYHGASARGATTTPVGEGSEPAAVGTLFLDRKLKPWNLSSNH